ncbi:MAG: adenosylcobinamide-GDP ribazoletransferase [Candidatus Bathyarchaeota archaeon]|nr:adenosylcobinamide-GDP ribazoletransferase [Candidatus Bathyarchaeota archaeon]
MSKLDAIKTFRELLSFLTVIPLGETEDFVFASARNMFLFPLVGGLIGVLGAGYFLGSSLIIGYLLAAASSVLHVSAWWLPRILPAAMTLAFLLVLTGFQHFDGLIDLGNAIGVRKVEDRREIAHRWVVTYKGAFLALFVELSAVAGLFLLDWNVAWRALILAEVAAKLAMVTIVWRGKPAHQGLGARFIEYAKRNLNIAAYALAAVLGFALLGWAGLLVIAAAAAFGWFMVQVAKGTFGGVSGDMIGATNESARALALVLVAAVLVYASALFGGALFF